MMGKVKSAGGAEINVSWSLRFTLKEEVIACFRSSILHDVLINVIHLISSEKYCLKTLAGLSCATNLQRTPGRLVIISPDLLHMFIYTWCFNQCQSPERYCNISENVGCMSKKVPQSLFPRTRLSSLNSKFISGWQLRCRGHCSRACRFWLQHFSWRSLIGEGGLGPRSL